MLLLFFQLLVYAQLFANGAPSEMVIPPAFIGRRVHSNPTTPSFVNGYSHVPGRNPYQNQAQPDSHNRRALAYDQFLVSVK